MTHFNWGWPSVTQWKFILSLIRLFSCGTIQESLHAHADAKKRRALISLRVSLQDKRFSAPETSYIKLQSRTNMLEIQGVSFRWNHLIIWRPSIFIFHPYTCRIKIHSRWQSSVITNGSQFGFHLIMLYVSFLLMLLSEQLPNLYPHPNPFSHSEH